MNERRTRDEVIRQEAGKAGLRGRINAKCVECIYDPSGAGSWLKQVGRCPSPDCPLYEVRPRSKGVNDV